MGAADAALVRELQDPLGARVDRFVDGMPETGDLPSGGVNLRGDLERLATRRTFLLEQPRALLRRAEDDRAGAEDSRRDGAL